MNETASTMPGWQRNLLIILCCIILLFSAGYTTGVAAAGIEHGFGVRTFALIGGGILLAAVSGVMGWKLYSNRPAEPVAPRIRKSQHVILISALVGGVIGLVLALSTVNEDPFRLFGNGPIPPQSAIFAIIVWLIAIPLLSWTWFRSIDEHEARANADGALAGIYTYFLILPSWWMGWRGGFLPEPQSMIIFLVVLAVYCAVWLWRKSS